ncbi:hypothetical protein [Massilia scottii]|uniref:hypothetical protein n=1 Tax=Massilia scottii TaxID=3057166 RepID=UPI0027963F68|nr:hypothetical protein [Massilia sp. CCM 9029]MDQ1835533.1 hypothetical protein [Massilia sp. CCM 9029]
MLAEKEIIVISINGYFESLHFTECRLGQPMVENDTLQVRVSNLHIMKGHPLCTQGSSLVSGVLMFIGIKRSIRKVTEYIGDPKNPDGFRDEYLITDIEEVDIGGAEVFLMEGVTEQPSAWIDWEIRASRFELQVD